ncbi:MAG: hypothetical protein AAGA28_18945 [Pseudomonadota bacterium]
MTATSPRLIAALLCLCLIVAGAASLAQTDWRSDHLDPADAGGPRRLQVKADDTPLFHTPSDSARTDERLPRAALLANLGCGAQGAQLWCRVAPLGGGAAGFVHAADVAPAAGPDGRIVTGADDSRARARRRDFDATDQIACAQNPGDRLGTCRASVARSGGGDAAVVVTFPNSFARALWFTNGEFMRANTTMSGVGTDTEWTLEQGVFSIRVDDQRFAVPRDFVLGE